MRRYRADGGIYGPPERLSSPPPSCCLRPLVLFNRQRGLLFGLETEAPVDRHAGSGRDQVADDDVLLQAAEVVHLALDRGLGEHPRGLLEGGRRDEAVGRERRLGDAEQQRLIARRLLALPRHALVLLLDDEAVDVLALEERRV